MFVTFLPAKTLMTLAFAAVLAVIAVALLGISTAHARRQYRLSLQH